LVLLYKETQPGKEIRSICEIWELIQNKNKLHRKKFRDDFIVEVVPAMDTGQIHQIKKKTKTNLFKNRKVWEIITFGEQSPVVLHKS